jgi:AcrR family transcriptional regulator
LTSERSLIDNERVISGHRRRRERRPPHGAIRHHATSAPTDLRAVLIEAADHLLRTRGVAGLTTREIAREAGCSDGALYVHFADKAALLAAVCERWLPDLLTTSGDLVNRVGAATVAENLEAIATVAVRAFTDMAPLSYAIAGDPELLKHHRAALRSKGLGPRRGIEAVRAYLAAEQRVGRVREDAECEITASILISTCWQRAAMRHYFAEDIVQVDDATYAAQVAATLAAALEPKTTRT